MTQQRPGQISDDKLDRALDRTLAKYAAVEPRAGMEERILANLRTRPAVSYRPWWAWSAAVVFAAVVVAVALAWRSGKTTTPRMVEHHAAPMQNLPQPERVVGNHLPAEATQVRRTAKPARRHVVAIPRRAQFPSPQPLSDEEKALARYVQDFPAEAVLVAQKQQEDEIEMQKQMEEGR